MLGDVGLGHNTYGHVTGIIFGPDRASSFDLPGYFGMLRNANQQRQPSDTFPLNWQHITMKPSKNQLRRAKKKAQKQNVSFFQTEN